MNVRERRERDEQRARERGLVGMREMVIAAQSGFLWALGSAAITDCVDEVLARMTPEERVGDPEQVRGLWIYRATCRLINLQESAEMRLRDPVAIDEHAQALAVSVCGDVVELSEEARQCWRVEEVVHRVHDADQAWGQAYAERVLDASVDPGAQPRGLGQQLGWTPEQTRNASRRARATMAAFVQERASGEVCRDRQALLDSFIATNDRRGRAHSQVLDQERFLAMVFHIGGCHDCALAWRARRTALASRVSGVLALPLGAVSWAARVVQDLASSVDVATLSLRQRLGLGGGTGIAATTISAKTAAVCATAVCTVGAGGAELAGVLPPIVPATTHHLARKHAARHHARPAREVVTPAIAVTPAPAGPTRPPAQATSVADTPASPEERFTPGDLPPASSTSPDGASAGSVGVRSSAPSDLPSASSTSAGGSSTSSPDLGSVTPAPPPAPPPPTAGDGAHCVLGDLGC
jgi:hypothetical protein